MDKFSESIDSEALKVIEEKLAGAINKTPNCTENSRNKLVLRRSKTINGSSSFVASDDEVIDESPITERVNSLREIRDKIQRNISIRPLRNRTSLKRNNSESVIRRSSQHHEPPVVQENVAKPIEGSNFNDIDSLDSSRLKSLLARAEAANLLPNGIAPTTETEKYLMDASDFSIIKTLGQKNTPPSLKRQRSDDVSLMRFNSDTPMSSQEVSMLNLPIMNSQDLNLIETNNLLESTQVTKCLNNIDENDFEMNVEENLDHENITFTKQNTMEMFHLVADLRSAPLKDEEDLDLELSNINRSSFSLMNSRTTAHKYELTTTHVEQRSFVDESLNLKLIASWNLPKQIEREYQKKGIVEMFEWQAKCLNNPRVLMENKNLVYSAPTSAGKTLVSEILMIKSVLERKKKALLILPFVSVVREKMFYLQDLLSSSGIRVDGFFGGYSPPGGFEATQLAVCTIEKANSIVNKLLEQKKLDTLGIIVVDEIHLIGDANRGYILELLLAKMLYMTRKHPAIRIQVVAMSATLPKMELLCEWLDAEMYTTDFRPVALNEMIKVNRNIYNNQMELIRTLGEDAELSNDQDNIAQLCLETIAEQCSVIVFCPTKERCEKLSMTVAEAIYKVQKKETEFGAKIKQAISAERLLEVKEQLKLNCPTGLDEVLSKTIKYGCAFHHASLTTEERDIIETSFKSGALKLIAATSTLSSGVNLPARRVIIRTPMFGGKTMNSLVYKQMIGRAGRTGKDTIGESILVCTDQTRKSGEELVMAKLVNPVTSCLVTRPTDESGEVEYNMNNIKRAVLEIIAAGVATTNEDLKSFVHSTLFYVEHKDLFQSLDFETVARQKCVTKGLGKYPGQADEDSEENALLECIKFLIEYEFVRLQVDALDENGEVHFFATRLGVACLSSSLPPADGFLLFSELQRSRQCFVLESELHAIYLVTPYSVCNQMNDIDWLLFLDLWEKLPAPLQRVGELVGIKDSFIVKAMRAIKRVDYKLMQIHKRFYIALALQELVNEMSINEVAAKFKMTRGVLQSLQQMSGTFAGIVTAFCNSLNWTMLSLIVGQFKERLFFGIHPDLMDLMRIPSLNSQRARAMHKNGIESLWDLAQASAFAVEKILYDQAEFQSEKQRDGEQEYETDERNKIRGFFVTGRMGLTVKEGAALMIKEAQAFIEMEIGLKSIKWSTQKVQVVGSPENRLERVGSGEVVDMKPALKRHSTEELLDDMVVDTKRTRSGEGSFGTKFSNDLFDLEAQDQIKIPAVASPNDTQPLQSDYESTDEDEGEEFINRSHLMNDEKFEKVPPVNISEIKIIDICGDMELFRDFKKFIVESKSLQEVGLSVGVTAQSGEEKREPEVVIGGHVMIPKHKTKDKSQEIGDNRILSGVSLCFSDRIGVVFYVDLNSTTVVPWDHKVGLLCTLFQQKKFKVCCYDLRQQLKALFKIIPGLVVGAEVKCADPKIANWLMLAMSSDHYLNQFHEMVKMYTPEYCEFVQLLCYDEKDGLYASGLNGHTSVSPSKRSAIEAVLVLCILKYQEASLEPELATKLFKTFSEVEMPMQVILAVMECTGIQVNRDKWECLVDQMKEAAVQLEKRIYATYGKRFNLRSTNELKRIMGVTKGAKISVKEALETKGSELSALIMQHRKIGGVLNKMIYPMARNIHRSRIYPNNECFTATGRINMAEPSIQTLAKDFEINVDKAAFGDDRLNISIRSLFEPKSLDTRCFVSADFCQLELRILAHFSEDKALLKIFKSSQDVFQAIAAKWNNLLAAKVTEELRNETKQMCYGIIYGMGVRSLAAALRVEELIAQQRIEEFHKTYPGIRKFIEKVLESVAKTGYVETLNGRRRYFPHLQLSDEEEVQRDAMKAQYERQAVNTMIQGSAADILKMAIIKVEQALKKKKVDNLRINSDVPISDLDDSFRVDMVLHLHDELMYDVPMEKFKSFSKTLRQSMESAAVLKVPLRVKVKSGPNWGELKEII